MLHAHHAPIYFINYSNVYQIDQYSLLGITSSPSNKNSSSLANKALILLKGNSTMAKSAEFKNFLTKTSAIQSDRRQTNDLSHNYTTTNVGRRGEVIPLKRERLRARESPSDHVLPLSTKGSTTASFLGEKVAPAGPPI